MFGSETWIAKQGTTATSAPFELRFPTFDPMFPTLSVLSLITKLSHIILGFPTFAGPVASEAVDTMLTRPRGMEVGMGERHPSRFLGDVFSFNYPPGGGQDIPCIFGQCELFAQPPRATASTCIAAW